MISLSVPTTSEVPKRRLGRTGELVSAIGLGGFHIGMPHQPDADAIALIHAAVDRGITFLDNSWDYNAGTSELRMGRALSYGGYRDRVFLMTKIDGRTKAAAAEQIEQSLNRLLTDHLDLLQFHENIRPDDADRIFAPGGAFEAVMEAKRAGKIRFVGFTGHKNPDYHLHMIDVATANGFTFDTVQMPLNVMDAHYESFEKKVIPVALGLDMGILAMKTFGDPHILATKAVDPIDMLHYRKFSIKPCAPRRRSSRSPTPRSRVCSRKPRTSRATEKRNSTRRRIFTTVPCRTRPGSASRVAPHPL
jgi:aryl-alcohol dehydrogenase-like predicted oxidoreductase